MRNPLDYEVMRGLAVLCDNDPAAMQAMMGAVMGAAPQYYDQLAGGAVMGNMPEYYDQLAALMGWGGLIPGDPQAALGALMGLARRTPFHGGHPMQRPMHPGLPHPGAGNFPQVPLNMVQPQIPGVSQRGGRVQPLGFENGAFVAGGSAVVVVRARPERPFRGGRLVGSAARTGASATGLLTLVALQVGTDGQLLSADPISFDSLAPSSFGVQVDLTPAAVGNSVTATVAISVLPTMTDRVDFNLTAYGHTLG